MHNIPKSIILILFSIQIVFSEEITEITGISIETKQNGYMVSLSCTRPVLQNNLTSWYAPTTGWFYISILHAKVDSASLSTKKTTFPILEIQASTEDSSAQIAIKSARYIEQSEFYFSENPPEILASLRFPIEELIAKKEDEAEFLSSNMNPVSKNVLLIRKGLYFIGASLFVAGIIDQDHGENLGWELPTGAGMIVGTWLWEKYGY
ncbi:MAG: hypothetical protein HOF04_01825 [Candidatus Marinimicrobia bacterium]|nr:hypothetical protein [Candidatus Neomarinimicrobiota bacterium]MBT3996998.1 hypothetical protein [Candidatus Neomarinimicrobiota bacterium]MBT7871816.1 hypothetical protein [Candidatus Neomarinimicrobiota bacterium]